MVEKLVVNGDDISQKDAMPQLPPPLIEKTYLYRYSIAASVPLRYRSNCLGTAIERIE